MSGREIAPPQEDKLLALLTENGIAYIDNRRMDGPLWIFGGSELNEVVRKAKELGFTFKYKGDGSRATKWKAGWWTK